MKRTLIFFSLALLVAAGLPALAQTLPPDSPPIYEGPKWFPEPPAMVFDLLISHPSEDSDLTPPDGLVPTSYKPGAGSPGSTRSQSAVSVNTSSGMAGGSVLAGSTLGNSFNPAAELDGRVRDARRALDS